ncbi:exonuclease SbcCD subunit D, partial [Streptomyces sp. SID7760]|nr:exonuclease SbcCD subunit D [Streptomyces sp. SID7760]
AARFPHTLSLAFDPEDREESGGASYAQRLKGRSDQEIAEDFVAHVRGGGIADEAERAVLQGAFEDVRADESRQETRR